MDSEETRPDVRENKDRFPENFDLDIRDKKQDTNKQETDSNYAYVF